MAWEKTEWACGHDGYMQLYGKNSARDAKVAHEAGRTCFACWLVEQWENGKDPRAQREDRYQLAAKIAEGKGRRIDGLPISAAVKGQARINVTDLNAEREKLIERIREIDALLNAEGAAAARQEELVKAIIKEDLLP